MITVDLPAARAALKWAIETHGAAHIDEYCAYVMSEGIGCLIGEALLHLGVPRGALMANNGFTIDKAAKHMRADQVVMLSPAAVEYLTMAQDVQDEGKTWGEAYAAAEAMVVEV